MLPLDRDIATYLAAIDIEGKSPNTQTSYANSPRSSGSAQRVLRRGLASRLVL